MPRHPMPYRRSSESSQDASPPGSVKSNGKRERIKDAVDHFFDKFRRHHPLPNKSRHQRTRSVDMGSQVSSINTRDSKRPKSLIVTSGNRPSPIPVSVVPNMDSSSSVSSRSSDVEHDVESQRSKQAAVDAEQVALVDGDATPRGYDVSSFVDKQDAAASMAEPMPESVESTPTGVVEAASQTEGICVNNESLDDSIIIVPSPVPESELTDTLTTEEESVASLSPELPPVHIPDFDVERLDLDGSDSDSVSEVPATPSIQAAEFNVPIIVVSTDVESPVRESTILSPIQESASEYDVSSPKSPVAATAALPIQRSPSNSASPSSQTHDENADSPSLSHYLVHLVAPHKDLQHTLDRLRPPLGYSMTILCYSLTWWLVTKTPSQLVF